MSAPDWMPGAVQLPLDAGRNYTPARRYRRGLVLHTAASSGTGRDHYTYWKRDAPKVSAHFYIDYDGTITQMVPLSAASWTSVEGSWSTIGVETQGHPSEPWTPQQVEALARICAWCSEAEGWPLQAMPSTNPANRGVGYHQTPYGGESWNPGAHYCPGNQRVSQIPQIISRAKQLRAGTTPTPQEDEMRFARAANGTIYLITADGVSVALASMLQLTAAQKIAKSPVGGLVQLSADEAAAWNNVAAKIKAAR